MNHEMDDQLELLREELINYWSDTHDRIKTHRRKLEKLTDDWYLEEDVIEAGLSRLSDGIEAVFGSWIRTHDQQRDVEDQGLVQPHTA